MFHVVVGVSLSNYRKIPKGSFLDEDSDLSNDEWEPKLDSFEVVKKIFRLNMNNVSE